MARPFTAAMRGFFPVRRDNPPKPERGRGARLLFSLGKEEFEVFHSVCCFRDLVGLKNEGCGDGQGTFQISPCAKSPSLARNDADAQGRLVVKPCPDRIELSVPRRVDAVEVLGPAERDEEDVRRGEGELSEGSFGGRVRESRLG